MSEDEVASVMATIDEDGGGDIDLGEFTNWFLGLDKKEDGEKISKIGMSCSNWFCTHCSNQPVSFKINSWSRLVVHLSRKAKDDVDASGEFC